MRHGEISRNMFPHYPIDSITNGVHALTWTSLPFRNLYDRYIPEWRRDNFYLRYATKIPLAEVRSRTSLTVRRFLWPRPRAALLVEDAIPFKPQTKSCNKRRIRL